MMGNFWDNFYTVFCDSWLMTMLEILNTAVKLLPSPAEAFRDFPGNSLLVWGRNSLWWVGEL